VFNVFPDVLCVHTSFLKIYIFLQFIPFLFGLFKSETRGSTVFNITQFKDVFNILNCIVDVLQLDVLV
jgi:hypothetical protein